MSQDITADGLNMLMNAKRAGKASLKLPHHSVLLLNVLAIAKLRGYVKSYHAEGITLQVTLGKIHGCRAIKPRFIVGVKDIEKYIKRYLPAKLIGTLIISTNKGLMTHQTAIEKNIGGCLIAYFY